MRMKAVQGDITCQQVDAVVNAASQSLLEGAAWTAPFNGPAARSYWPSVRPSAAVRQGTQDHRRLPSPRCS